MIRYRVSNRPVIPSAARDLLFPPWTRRSISPTLLYSRSFTFINGQFLT
jgi:hypothetical protein